MTITKAKDYLKEVLKQNSSTRERKVYNRFLKVLLALEDREFSEEEMDMINTELTRLDLTKVTTKRKAYLRKKLRSFLGFINNNFSLVVNNHYSEYGMSLGIAFGVAIGTSVFRDSNGSSLGICAGLIIGYLIGIYMDKTALKENRVLNIT